ncbi:hypothetical protein K504DRAFT_478161 [Pleomassaria siparia CBS 279.74]|uniref:Membrane fusion mating protein FIG1 n=1 Tax=Pleomassaria siparia CBS 279.74 TaxID=1314801 RepID=A0A6G1KPQ3_9PLEO|nr:hypothetical protein K504DRAFT_478161 [Pleomassaria siparia CBS 279.74]
MVKSIFLLDLRGLLAFLGYHHILMMVQASTIILLSILLAGCSSYSTMTNIYIMGLTYSNSTSSGLNAIETSLSEALNGFKGSSQLEVRTGYFGMCVRQRGILWLCSSDTNGLVQQIGPENDPLNLIGVAAKFRDDVLFSGLFIPAIVLTFFSLLLYRSTGSDVDVQPFPSRPISQVALSCSFVAAILCLVSSLWQHVGGVGAAAMADIAFYGNVSTTIGAGAIILGWMSFLLITLVTIGLVAMIIAIDTVNRLTSDE